MTTLSERIADLQQAIERHKSLAILLTSWAKARENDIDRGVNMLRSLRESLAIIERETAEAEAQLAQIQVQPPVVNE